MKNMLNQVHGEGNIHFLFEEVIDLRIDGSETNKKDAFIVTQNGNIDWW